MGREKVEIGFLSAKRKVFRVARTKRHVIWNRVPRFFSSIGSPMRIADLFPVKTLENEIDAKRTSNFHHESLDRRRHRRRQNQQQHQIGSDAHQNARDAHGDSCETHHRRRGYGRIFFGTGTSSFHLSQKVSPVLSFFFLLGFDANKRSFEYLNRRRRQTKVKMTRMQEDIENLKRLVETQTQERQTRQRTEERALSLCETCYCSLTNAFESRVGMCVACLRTVSPFLFELVFTC